MASADQARITSANVDLTNCDRELIQFSNAVQPHAALVAIDMASGKIVQASSNIRDLTGRTPCELIGKEFQSLLKGGEAAPLEEILDQIPEYQPPQFLATGTFNNGRRNIFIHRNDGVAILELEKEPLAIFPSLAILYSRLREGIGLLQRAPTLKEVLQHAVDLISNCTGFERVMAYKFLEDRSGHVVAECVKPDLEKFLGLHYPASDIPAPARRLFSLSWLRHLPAVSYDPIPIEPAINPISNEILDLSYAFSRSVSVMYTQYLKNMGVQATMVFTLLKKGKLWGLISCMHHSAPRHIPHEVRAACELLGHTLSLLIAAREDQDEYNYRERLDDLQSQLIDAMGRGSSLSKAFHSAEIDLLGPLEANGFALVLDGEVQSLGQTPSRDEILHLAGSLANRDDTVWQTDQLATQHDSAKAFANGVAGVLAARISRRKADYLFWFRGEYVQTVNWAGDPTKPVVTSENNEMRLSPRGSFSLWKTEVAGKSKPWRQCEKDFAVQLRRAIVEVILETSRQHGILTARIARGQVELDAYLALASHDLKEPLRGIHNYSQLLLRSAKDRLTGTEVEQLNTVAGLAQRMDHMIENLLGYSRAAESGGRLEQVDTLSLCHDAIALLKPASNVEIVVQPDLPIIKTDPEALQQIFYHLLSNAIQYNLRDSKRVEVGSQSSQTATFFVRDNGIGIPPGNREDVFKLFKRLHRRDEFGGGIGAGLATVRRLVEQLQGRIWIESVVGDGTTFYFTVGDDRD